MLIVMHIKCNNAKLKHYRCRVRRRGWGGCWRCRGRCRVGAGGATAEGVVFVVEAGDGGVGVGVLDGGDEVAVGVVDAGGGEGFATALGAVETPAVGKMDIPQFHGLSIYPAGS